jgi:hypothetical protein
MAEYSQVDKKRLWEIAKKRQLTAVYSEGAAALRAFPEYTYTDDHPRGGPSGWGVYSYPAGPSQPGEVTGGIPQ